MTRLARALYERGLDPRAVLRECYGVAFPDEFFVLAEARPVLMFEYTYQPWDLAVPLTRGGPPPDRTDDLETDILARDADLVPLGVSYSIGSAFGGVFWCYRVTELAAGRSTIYSIEYDVTPESPVTRLADSLLDALYRHHVEGAESLKRERERTIGFRSGGGEVDDGEVETAKLFVERIEELRRRVGSSP
ncbi:hypothetical protein H4696_003118 [Amycolatopsis lexingtonensis]|uniref:SUKH-4 immunity protein n=1 Tax=Amycolatopsis lexingtonensis TaxID=218822 RepID=A0ABR9HYK1_9PSEU|nr:hypothetical protein [Amycolatopsis lexingtonensis]MBE1496018.1 hypothetical protein [Amycolatopsis lexingtonensis]